MSSPSRILVPVDFSDCSRAALGRALKLAAGESAEVRVVHIYDPPYYAPEVLVHQPDQPPLALAEYTRQSAQRLLDAFVRPFGAPARFEAVLSPGQAFEAIPGEAAKWSATLIVMGTNGRQGVSRWLLGSVAERTVQSAPCPVLIVRGETSSAVAPPDFRRVLVPVDLGPQSAAQARLALDFARRGGATVSLLHVVPLSDRLLDGWTPETQGGEQRETLRKQARARLNDFAQTVTPSGADAPAVEISAGVPAKEIETVAKRLGTDLLVLGTQGRTGLSRFLMGSVAQQVLRTAGCSVLVLPSVGAND